MHPPEPPLFHRIANDLRAQIRSGDLAPGSQLPTQADLMRAYGVSDGVIKNVMRLLTSEGLVRAKRGAGTFVQDNPPRQQLTRSWWRPGRGGSPFLQEMAGYGKTGSWTFTSEEASAPPEICTRLGLDDPGEGVLNVMRTDYEYRADDGTGPIPVQLATSYESLLLTKGEIIAYPEAGPYGGRGVVERMMAIGVEITHDSQIVSARPATMPEAEALRIAPGGLVLTIARTYWADTRPIETADIRIPVDRYEVVFGAPVYGLMPE